MIINLSGLWSLQYYRALIVPGPVVFFYVGGFGWVSMGVVLWLVPGRLYFSEFWHTGCLWARRARTDLDICVHDEFLDQSLRSTFTLWRRGQDQAQEKTNQKPKKERSVSRLHVYGPFTKPSSSKVWVIKLDRGKTRQGYANQDHFPIDSAILFTQFLAC